MNKTNKPFCVHYTLGVCIAVFLVQSFLPSLGWCSTGASSSQSGATLVKKQLSHALQQTPATRPVKIYAIQPGDVFCDILVKVGLSRKDALYISKKAGRVYKLNKMRPGSELELYFSPDGSGLQEVDYKVKRLKKMVLYNGKVIKLAQGASTTVPAMSTQPAPKAKDTSQTIANRQATILKVSHLAVFPAPKAQSNVDMTKQLKIRPVSAKAHIPQTKTVASVQPARTMKTFSSYNCGLPESFHSTPQSPYEMLASGMVQSPVLPPWDKDSLNATMQRQTSIIETQDNSSAKHNPTEKKKDAVLHKKARVKKALRDSIAKPAEPLFLKAPLTYRYVSSGFTYNRLDPFTNEAQPHLGIDYSAPSGTPVHAIGPGRVQSMGWDGGYGKTIRIVHTDGYISQYAHLSHFARNMIMGKRVRKGEIIGYVGMTGHATGPHLDFRVTHRGTFINPVNLEYSSRKAPSKKNADKPHHIPRG